MAHIDSGFSKRLIDLRRERNVSQVDFGKALGIPRSTISGYESEGKEPDYDTLSKMADYFGVSADYLLGRTDERRPCDIVFHNDAANFKKHYEELPRDLRNIVSECFDEFYVLLGRDVRNEDAERLALYLEMLKSIRLGRSEIRNAIDGLSAGSAPSASVASVISKQGEMKTKIGAVLDALLDSDMRRGK